MKPSKGNVKKQKGVPSQGTGAVREGLCRHCGECVMCEEGRTVLGRAAENSKLEGQPEATEERRGDKRLASEQRRGGSPKRQNTSASVAKEGKSQGYNPAPLPIASSPRP